MKKTLNARSETLFTTPMYRSAASNRCLVFVDGFFVWKHEGKEKLPHYIQMPEHGVFTLGGIYTKWRDKEGGELTTCSIITTPANELMTTIHNSKKRMPLILPKNAWSAWLDPKAKREHIEHLMRSYPEGALEAREISKLITTRGVETNVPEVQQ